MFSYLSTQQKLPVDYLNVQIFCTSYAKSAVLECDDSLSIKVLGSGSNFGILLVLINSSKLDKLIRNKLLVL